MKKLINSIFKKLGYVPEIKEPGLIENIRHFEPLLVFTQSELTQSILEDSDVDFSDVREKIISININDVLRQVSQHIYSEVKLADSKAIIRSEITLLILKK